MIAGIIGATGYAGAELVRLLSGHPNVDTLILSSVSFEGGRIEEVYPNFLGTVSAPLVRPEAALEAGVVFAALPHGVGESWAAAALEKKIPFIDLSADFRFGDDEDTYAAWYGRRYTFPGLREFSVYGLPELNRKRIREYAERNRVITGNPGCYPTGASLAAFPSLSPRPDGQRLAAAGAVVIVDSASGVTGGGREPSRSFHFPECSGTVSPYKVGSNRHTPEIARTFAAMSAGAGASCGGEPSVIFTPHLVPMNRGILSTVYIQLAESWRAKVRGPSCRPPSPEVEEQAGRIRETYAEFYRDEPFVRVLPAGIAAVTGRVRGSNFCDISVHLDAAGSTLIVVSAIDNMVKGAAGQAVQNMNVIFGFDEKAGLEAIPALF
jgi:N-acetyl-gamma-glutamyl-phosphate reductase